MAPRKPRQVIPRKRVGRQPKRATRLNVLKQINLHAAGIAIGATQHYVAVPDTCAPDSVRHFETFTPDLPRLADWLTTCQVTTVVMESTGVYWIPLFELLEQRGFGVFLVDARHVKNVPGRKTDVLDCQWLQQLHTFGLLRGAFRPSEQACVFRSYLRQRAMLAQCAAQHIQHMQKALTPMNLKLQHVVQDLTGKTGLMIIRAILADTCDPHHLATYRDPRCQHDEATIAKALVGNYRAEHLFELQQAVDLFDVYQAKITDCDTQTERHLRTFADRSGDRPLGPRQRSQPPCALL